MGGPGNGSGGLNGSNKDGEKEKTAVVLGDPDSYNNLANRDGAPLYDGMTKEKGRYKAKRYTDANLCPRLANENVFGQQPLLSHAKPDLEGIVFIGTLARVKNPEFPLIAKFDHYKVVIVFTYQFSLINK
ncbi:Mucin-12 [Manis pentadactyla]|nr:Mucin-12 [Manis pentadactyla]